MLLLNNYHWCDSLTFFTLVHFCNIPPRCWDFLWPLGWNWENIWNNIMLSSAVLPSFFLCFFVLHTVFHCLLCCWEPAVGRCVWILEWEHTERLVFTVQPHRLKIPSPGSAAILLPPKHQEKQESLRNFLDFLEESNEKPHEGLSFFSSLEPGLSKLCCFLLWVLNNFMKIKCVRAVRNSLLYSKKKAWHHTLYPREAPWLCALSDAS